MIHDHMGGDTTVTIITTARDLPRHRHGDTVLLHRHAGNQPETATGPDGMEYK